MGQNDAELYKHKDKNKICIKFFFFLSKTFEKLDNENTAFI